MTHRRTPWKSYTARATGIQRQRSPVHLWKGFTKNRPFDTVLADLTEYQYAGRKGKEGTSERKNSLRTGKSLTSSHAECGILVWWGGGAGISRGEAGNTGWRSCAQPLWPTPPKFGFSLPGDRKTCRLLNKKKLDWIKNKTIQLEWKWPGCHNNNQQSI